MNRRNRLATVLALVAVAGCGIQPDAAPRDLPEPERNIVISGSSAGPQASGADRIYLVAPGEERRLRSVPRDALSPQDLFEILLLGPNDDEVAAQWSTFIPPSTELRSLRPTPPFLTVNLSSEFTELTGQGLAQAIAQIVYTATEIDGIEAVQLEVEGEKLPWPKGNGETTTEALRVYDYPNLVQTAQPAYPALPVGA